jgi:hypothetical protein
MGFMAARARKTTLLGRWRSEAQEFAQRRGTCPVQRRTHRHLDGFQIQAPGLAATLENGKQQLLYFARYFPADGFGRFFSSGESTSGSEGRMRQINALTSISSLCRPCSFRNSAISLAAFRAAE